MPKPKFEIEPLPFYCINFLELGDLLVYKVLLRVHPLGVNFILIKLKIYHCNFKKKKIWCEKGGLCFEGLCAH